MTHNYKRNGTTTLFGALEILRGRVVGECFERHRHQELLRFLRRLDQEISGRNSLHLVLDNYGTHQHPRVQTWLQRHPRFVPHFVPTSSSWLNLVERWFWELTRNRIRRGSFGSVENLEKAIEEFWPPGTRNPNPSFGPPPSHRSWRNYRAAARPLKEFSQAAACHEGENRKRDLLRYFADTTLRLWQFKVPLSKRIFDGCAGERPTGVHGRIDSPLILLVTYESVAMLFR